MLGIIIALYLKAKVNALHFMAPLLEKLSHDVLLNEFTKNLRTSWTENEEIL